MFLKVKSGARPLPHRAGHYIFNPVCHIEIPDERAKAMLQTDGHVYEEASKKEFLESEGRMSDLAKKMPPVFSRSLPPAAHALVDADGQPLALKSKSEPFKNVEHEQLLKALATEKEAREKAEKVAAQLASKLKEIVEAPPIPAAPVAPPDSSPVVDSSPVDAGAPLSPPEQKKSDNKAKK